MDREVTVKIGAQLKAGNPFKQLSDQAAEATKEIKDRLETVQERLRDVSTLRGIAKEELAERMGISRADREMSRFVGRAMEGVASLKRSAAQIQLGGDPERLLGGLHKIEAASARIQRISEASRHASMEGFSRIGGGTSEFLQGIAKLSGSEEQLEQVLQKLKAIEGVFETLRGAKEIIAGVVGGIVNLNKALESMTAARRIEKGLGNVLGMMGSRGASGAAHRTDAVKAARANVGLAESAGVAERAGGLGFRSALVLTGQELRAYRRDADAATRANLRLAMSADANRVLQGGPGTGNTANQTLRQMGFAPGGAGAAAGGLRAIGGDGAAAAVRVGGEAAAGAGGIAQLLTMIGGGSAAMGAGILGVGALGLGAAGLGIAADVAPEGTIGALQWLMPGARPGDENHGWGEMTGREVWRSVMPSVSPATWLFREHVVNTEFDTLEESQRKLQRMNEAQRERERRKAVFEAGYAAGQPYRERISGAQESMGQFGVEAASWADDVADYGRRRNRERYQEKVDKWATRALDPHWDSLTTRRGMTSAEQYDFSMRAWLNQVTSEPEGTIFSRTGLAYAKRALEFEEKRQQDLNKWKEDARLGREGPEREAHGGEGIQTQAERTAIEREQADIEEKMVERKKELARAEVEQAKAERDRLERYRQMLHEQQKSFEMAKEQAQLQKQDMQSSVGLMSPHEQDRLTLLNKKLDHALAHPGQVRQPRTIWVRGRAVQDPGAIGNLTPGDIQDLHRHPEIFGERLRQLGKQRFDEAAKRNPALRDLAKEGEARAKRAEEAATAARKAQEEVDKKIEEQNKKIRENAERAAKDLTHTFAEFLDHLTDLMRDAIQKAKHHVDEEFKKAANSTKG